VRRYLALALPLVAALGVLPATADPATPGRMAQVAFTLHPSPGEEVRLAVVVSTSAAGQRIEVGRTDCQNGSCDVPRYYSGMLPKGAVTIDGAQAIARLRTTLDGRSFAVDWRPVPPGTVFIQGTHGGGTDGDLAFTVYRADPAAARVVLAGRPCSGSASVGDQVRFEVPEGSDGNAIAMSGLQVPDGAPVCES
jgi:hypothetical protein